MRHNQPFIPLTPEEKERSLVILSVSTQPISRAFLFRLCAWALILTVLAVCVAGTLIPSWQEAALSLARVVDTEMPVAVSTPLEYSRIKQAQSEIAALHAAVRAFQDKFGFYPPSRVRLRRDLEAYHGKDALDGDSNSFVSRLGRGNFDPYLPHDWSGGLQSGFNQALLEGDQCLVFFLGGIPDWDKQKKMPLYLGFGDGLPSPAWPGGRRVGPFYNFDPTRLIAFHDSAFLSYLDPWGTPYAYFCCVTSYAGGKSAYGGSDCAKLGVWPYAANRDPNNPHVKTDTGLHYLIWGDFQIISAGPDGRFGRGTVTPGGQTWTAKTADQLDLAGRDDLASFHDRPLGQSVR